MTSGGVLHRVGARTAAELGIPTLVFVLAEDALGPAVMFRDTEYGARQDAFRARLADSGVTTAPITTPGDLEAKLLQALHEHPRPTSPSAPGEVRRLWTIPARTVEFNGRDHLLDDLGAALGSGDRVAHAVTGMGGVGKTTAAIQLSSARLINWVRRSNSCDRFRQPDDVDSDH